METLSDTSVSFLTLSSSKVIPINGTSLVSVPGQNDPPPSDPVPRVNLFEHTSSLEIPHRSVNPDQTEEIKNIYIFDVFLVIPIQLQNPEHVL